MQREEMQKRIKELGIVSIEPTGEFSKNLVSDAIRSTESIYRTIDLKKFAKEFDEKEAAINEIFK